MGAGGRVVRPRRHAATAHRGKPDDAGDGRIEPGALLAVGQVLENITRTATPRPRQCQAR